MNNLITGLAGGLVKSVGDIADDLITSDEERLQLEQTVYANETSRLSLQAEVNKVEASNPNLFVSGWRPAAGWVCVTGLFYVFIIKQILDYVWITLQAFGKLPSNIMPPPGLDIETLLSLLAALLGLSGFRTYEKGKQLTR